MLSVIINMCRPLHGAVQGLCSKRKLKTVSNKAQMKFSDKRMAPLGLLAMSLARHPGNIDFDPTTHWHQDLAKDKTWREVYENPNRNMGLMHKAAPFP